MAQTPDDESTQEVESHNEISTDQTLLYAKDLAAARASMRTLSRRIASKTQGNRTVLIADDDASLRLLVSTTLSGDEYTIIEAQTGVEALLMTKAQHPMLVLLDVNMPELDGLEVCRRIKSDPELQDVKIIILTGSARASDQEAADAAGADTYLTKPFRPLELLKIIDSSIL